MKFFCSLLLLGASVLNGFAQAPKPVPVTQPFGKIDKADLEMTKCDFEPDANAEVLFDKAEVLFDQNYNIVTQRHKRIKIFNDHGKNQANIHIVYLSVGHLEYISGLQAQTINLTNGVTEIFKVDSKQIFTEVIDKARTALVFSFPNIKPGCVIEYKYKLVSTYIANFPNWYFQSDLPTRYSELNTDIPDILTYKRLSNIHIPYIVDKTSSSSNNRTEGMAYIPSLKEEPYMGARNDNSERILFQLLNIAQTGRSGFSFQDSWTKVGENLMKYEDFGDQLNLKLAAEEVIINKAKGMKTDDEKIAFIFNEVKNAMKWNDINYSYTNDGTPKAWERKIGNSAEINIILYHLLKKAGLTVYPMLVSTRENGHINPAFPSTYQFNSTVAYIPVDSAKYYVLDASNKYNIYNKIPVNFLNSFGFYINDEFKAYELPFIADNDPVRQVVSITAEIKADGKMSGAADVTSDSYKRMDLIKRYKTEGEKKYLNFLKEDNNSLKISSLKFEDMEVDTLPLRQTLNFELDLPGTDDNYIYFNSNLFTGLKANPFLAENRLTNIDFGYRDNYNITGVFKIPAGYKVDALPKSVSMAIPDQSIVFIRRVIEQDGSILIRLNIDHKQSLFFKENYAEFRDFYKKMYDMLNEQIVLKKS